MRAPDEPGDTGCEKRGRALQALTRIFPPVLPFTQIGRCSALLICAYFRDAARKCAQDNVKNSAEGLQPIAVSLVSWIEGSPYTDRTLHLPGSFLEQGACNACSAKRIPVPRRAFDQPFTQARLILRRVAPVWQAKGLHPRLLDVKSTNGHLAGGRLQWPVTGLLKMFCCRRVPLLRSWICSRRLLARCVPFRTGLPVHWSCPQSQQHLSARSSHQT